LKEDERNTGKTVPKLKPGEIEQALPRWTVFAEAAELDCEHVRRWAQARTVVIAQRSWERNTPQSMRHTNDRIAALLS
jgi:streptomycin 6-kinase